jgi:tRNA U34 5-methylaminomethyl-2-thiouridine-forming methyltransferase MnmC
MQKQTNRSAQVSILEIGFGTGLNWLLTAIEAEKCYQSFYSIAAQPELWSK